MFLLFLTFSHFNSSQSFSAEISSKTKELAALKTQDQSIQKLERFIESHSGDIREAEFLSRLADLYLEKSGISFQYTEGESTRTNKNHYQNSLKKAVSALNQLIRLHPRSETISEAYFKRGKAHKELQQISAARDDLNYLVQQFRDFPRIDTALLDLAIFDQNENRHESALKHLDKLKKIDASPYRTIGYRKSAWSHFNLEQYQAAVEDLEKEISLYPDDAKEPPEVESAYTDLALFLFESINKKTAIGTIEKITKTIESICSIRSKKSNNTCHSISYLKMAKLLKAYQLGSALEELKESVIKKHLLLPETLQITLLLHQYWFERHEYGKLAGIIEEAINIQSEQKLNKTDSIIKTTEKTILELHELVSKNIKSTDLEKLIIPLEALTQILANKLEGYDPNRAKFIYSMAETAFSIKKYQMANNYYEKLLADDQKLPEKVSRNEIKRRLISSQYQELKSLKPGLIQFETRKTDAPLVEINKIQKKMIEKWVIETTSLLTDSSNESENFQFEAFKLAYLYLDRLSGLEKLIKLSLTAKTNEIRQSAASIVFDTYNLSNQNEKLVTPCQSAAWLKIDKIAEPCTLISAKASIAVRDFKKAEKILSVLNFSKANLETKKAISLLKSEIYLKTSDFRKSINEQETFLELSGWKETEMVKSVFQYHWLHQNEQKITKLMTSLQIKQTLTETYLDQFRAALEIDLPSKEYQRNFRASIKSAKNASSLWALSCLKKPKTLPYQDRLALVQRTASNWEYLDPYLQIRYLPLLKTRLSETIESIRKDAKAIAPLRIDTQSVEKRMVLLREIDLTFSKAMKLDWFEIKLKTLTELQYVFQDLIHELKIINATPDLLKPFQTKQGELANGIEQLISLNSEIKNPIDSSVLLQSEVINQIPEELREEWTLAKNKQAADLMHYLISLRPHDHQSDTLRGLVLFTMMNDSARTEGYQLIKSSSNKFWKEKIAMRNTP